MIAMLKNLNAAPSQVIDSTALAFGNSPAHKHMKLGSP